MDSTNVTFKRSPDDGRSANDPPKKMRGEPSLLTQTKDHSLLRADDSLERAVASKFHLDDASFENFHSHATPVRVSLKVKRDSAQFFVSNFPDFLVVELVSWVVSVCWCCNECDSASPEHRTLFLARVVALEKGAQLVIPVNRTLQDGACLAHSSRVLIVATHSSNSSNCLSFKSESPIRSALDRQKNTRKIEHQQVYTSSWKLPLSLAQTKASFTCLPIAPAPILPSPATISAQHSITLPPLVVPAYSAGLGMVPWLNEITPSSGWGDDILITHNSKRVHRPDYQGLGSDSTISVQADPSVAVKFEIINPYTLRIDITPDPSWISDTWINFKILDGSTVISSAPLLYRYTPVQPLMLAPLRSYLRVVEEGKIGVEAFSRKTEAKESTCGVGVDSIVLQGLFDRKQLSICQRTTIHLAVLAEDLQWLTLLLKNVTPAEVNARDVLGCTAAHYAAFLRYDRMLEALQEYHADFTIADRDNRTVESLRRGVIADSKKREQQRFMTVLKFPRHKPGLLFPTLPASPDKIDAAAVDGAIEEVNHSKGKLAGFALDDLSALHCLAAAAAPQTPARLQYRVWDPQPLTEEMQSGLKTAVLVKSALRIIKERAQFTCYDLPIKSEELLQWSYLVCWRCVNSPECRTDQEILFHPAHAELSLKGDLHLHIPLNLSVQGGGCSDHASCIDVIAKSADERRALYFSSNSFHAYSTRKQNGRRAGQPGGHFFEYTPSVLAKKASPMSISPLQTTKLPTAPRLKAKTR